MPKNAVCIILASVVCMRHVESVCVYYSALLSMIIPRRKTVNSQLTNVVRKVY